MEMIKRILVADTGVEFRRGLIRALAEDTGLQVVGETGDGAELLRMARVRSCCAWRGSGSLMQ